MPHIFSHYYQVHGFRRFNQDTQRFDDACKRFESNPNYQPTITNQQLMNLVRDSQENSIHAPKKEATAILPSAIHSNLGKVYEIRIALKSGIAGDDYPNWHIEDMACLVHKPSGRISCHKVDDAKAGNFNNPINADIDELLKRECLHPQSSVSRQLR